MDFYGLIEFEHSSAMDQVADLMKAEYFKLHNKPLHAHRLGRKRENGSPRPITVLFANEQDKWEFLKRANSKLRSENIFCNVDVCKETRDKEYNLREELRDLRKGDEKCKYRIRNL